jgi:hypothetical protein
MNLLVNLTIHYLNSSISIYLTITINMVNIISKIVQFIKIIHLFYFLFIIIIIFYGFIVRVVYIC